MEVIKIIPQGYCNGVKRAIGICKQMAKLDGKKYQLGRLINNKMVNKSVELLGIEIIDDIDSIDNDSTLLVTADGASEKQLKKLENKNVKIVDATCPIVKIIHELINKYELERKILYIGNKNHPEAKNIFEDHQNMININSYNDIDNLDKNAYYYLTNQTTLSHLDVEDLINYAKNKLPNLLVNNQICDATYKRQEAILKIQGDFIIVVGDHLSSNCNRLYELAKKNNPNALVLLIEGVEDLASYDLKKYPKCYITSGASTPNIITDEVIEYLEAYPNKKPVSKIKDTDYL